jgi:hypothetical protein
MGQSESIVPHPRPALNASRKSVVKFSETIRHSWREYKDLDGKLNQIEKEYIDQLLASREASLAKANSAPASTTAPSKASPPPTSIPASSKAIQPPDKKQQDSVEVPASDRVPPLNISMEELNAKNRREADPARGYCRDVTGGEEGYWEDAGNETLRFDLVIFRTV